MRILDLGGHRHARIWIGSLPDAAYLSVDVIKCTFPTIAEPRESGERVAIEILVPLGPRFMYGLLGCGFEPGKTGPLKVEVHVSAPKERVFQDSLAGRLDEVRVGLPAEYVKAIVTGVDSVSNQISLLGSGKISFDCAAHGDVGSCEAVYKHLAAMSIKLLSIASLKPSDDELTKMFPQTFS